MSKNNTEKSSNWKNWIIKKLLSDDSTKEEILSYIANEDNQNELKDLNDNNEKNLIKNILKLNQKSVEDIVGAIEVAMTSKTSAIIFNLSDDLPATQLDVAQFAASLLKRKCLEKVSIKSEMVSEMARSFYKEEKKVSNKRLKDELKYKLSFPSFKDGLRAIYKSSKEF